MTPFVASVTRLVSGPSFVGHERKRVVRLLTARVTRRQGISIPLLTLLHSCWGMLHHLVFHHVSYAGPTSGPALKEDLSFLSENPFKVLEGLDDVYPQYGGDISKKEKKNKFLRSTMQVLGGGETRLLEKLRPLERRGGGIDDAWKYMRLLDRQYEAPCPFTFPVSAQCHFLGITPGSLSPVSVSEAAAMASHNLDANPGPSFRALGFLKKRESISLAMDIANEIVIKAESESILDFLEPRYALAGRSKVQESEKVHIKAQSLAPFGRAVFMADQHETLVAGRYAYPLMNSLVDEFKVVMNGFNKFGDHPTKLSSRLERMNIFINVDFKMFDINCSPLLIERGLKVVAECFGVDLLSDNKESRIFKWLEREIISSIIVLPTGRCVRKVGGVPSGSGLTALLDSIINAIMWQEVLFRIGASDYEVFVQGDDVLLGLHHDAPTKSRKSWARDKVVQISKYFAELYGHEVNVEKTHIGTELFVGFAQPRVPTGVNDHSSRVVMEFRRAERARLGRPLTFDEQFIVLREEPVGPGPGLTHRWTYLFKDRAKFLSHYFKRDASSGSTMCVRPTAEVITNLLHPEGTVKTLQDHVERLTAAQVENMGNHHVTNRLMHYLYDAFVLRENGVFATLPSEHIVRRAWYRKIDRQVDLLTEDYQFFEYYRAFERKARKAHTAVFGGTYAEWGMIRSLRRGRQRFTIGGSLSRHPDSLEAGLLLWDRGFFKSIGPLGVNLWVNRPLRVEVLNRALSILTRPSLMMDGGDSLRLKNAIMELRTSYEATVVNIAE